MLVKARTTFHGDRFTIAAGTVLPADHPAVVGREGLFEPVDGPTPEPVAAEPVVRRTAPRRAPRKAAR